MHRASERSTPSKRALYIFEAMSFDLSEAVRFDLSRGTVHALGEERTVLLPVDALFDLVAAAGPEVAAAVGKEMGVGMGERVARRLGGEDGVREASLETVVNAIAMEMCVAGLGSFGIERWGKAMVLALDHTPRLGGIFITSLLEGTIQGATGAEVVCGFLSVDPIQRILVANRSAVAKVRAFIGEGLSWAEALARVQAEGTTP
jgi:hypothetical protein